MSGLLSLIKFNRVLIEFFSSFLISHSILKKEVIFIKLEILKDFKDKNNGTVYKKGCIVDFKKERAEEIIADKRNFVKKITERKKKK